MSITYDENGLQIQSQSQIREETADKLRGTMGEHIHLDPVESELGQFAEVMYELMALTQQAVAALDRSIDPDGAIGRPLDSRVGLTGTVRKGKTFSYVDGILTFTGAATVPNGARYKHDDTNTIWEVTDGPHTRVGAGTEACQLTAVEAGPLEAAAASDWTTVTVIANVDGFTNPAEGATKGRLREGDPTLKRRRRQEIYSQGLGPLEAIQGAVSKLEGVTTVRAYHNTSVFPADSDGIPFKAFNVVVETSPSTPSVELRQAIWEAIWLGMGGGGEAYGTDYEGTVTDTENEPQPVAFDVVVVKDVAIEVDLVTSTSETATTPNVADVVAAAVLELADAQHEKVGRDVRSIDYSGVVSTLLDAGTISGVDGVEVRLAFDPAAPADVVKLSVGIREKASFDSARIAVVEV